MKTKQLLLILLAAFLPSATWANYWYDPVTKLGYEYEPGGEFASVALLNDVSGDLVIPSVITIDGHDYTVTSIDYMAFNSCKKLTSVTIPNTVGSIGQYAFAGCSSLTAVTIPESVGYIGNGAFHECSSLTSVTIPENLHIIDDFVFKDCSKLASLTIGKNVTYIGREAFKNCSSLTSVIIPDSVRSITDYAFSGCSSLTSLTIKSKKLEYLWYSTFEGCNNLAEVHISDLTAWCNIYNEGNPLRYAHHLFLNGEEIKDLVIPNSITTIKEFAFDGCTGLTSLTIPDGVTAIEAYAFQNCSGLTSAIIPNSVTSIGAEAFAGCSSLSSITFPEQVSDIGSGAFDNTAWYNNQPEGVIYIGAVAFQYKGIMPYNTSITIKDGTLGLAGSAFANCYGLKSITIPNSVTSIGAYAFASCGLTTVTLPNSVTSIGEGAFSSSSLTSITIPNSVTSIGENAFERCNNLTSVTLSNNLKAIKGFTFSGCTELTSVTIPKSVEEIGYYAFDGCKKLVSVTSLIEEPFYIYGVFPNEVYENATLYVPFGTKESYMNTEGWNNFYNIVTLSGVQIAINETNFPDENFRNYLLDQSYGADGMLADNEMGVKVINVNNKGISSLKGIEYFTALKELDCSSNQLAALDLSGNVVLTKLDCSSNQLTALDVSENTSLTELECYSNQIKGAAMDALISSLPDKTDKTTIFRVIYNDGEATEGNVCTKEQVAAAIAKGWQPLEYKDKKWVSYEGSIEPVAINETNFPDENFRNYLLAQSYGEDGVLTENEISQVTSISVGDKEISSLKGIEHFTALKSLYCIKNQLSALDLSKNTALEYLECDENQLTALDLSKNTALRLLNCSMNQLTALDVSKNTALTGLDCSRNQLTALDVSNKTALTSISCYYNQLTALVVTNCNELTQLRCYSNQIKGAAMDALISSLPNKTGEKTTFGVIINLGNYEGNVCTKEQVAAATAKGWQPMEWTGWGWDPYEGSDGSDPQVGTEIAINETNFPDENFRNYLLAQSYGKDGVLTENEIKNITLMDVDKKEISSLKGIEHFTALKFLYCSNNQLTALDVSNNTALETLSCNKNQLTALDLSKNTALRRLYCYNNQLTALDVTNCNALETLSCDNNQLTDLDVSGNAALATLSCYSNQLTTLDVSGNTALKELECYSNQLTALDVSGNAALTTLKCYSNQLTTLDASGNTALTELECYSNKLTTLDVSGNTALTTIRCNGNQLTSLDVSTNTALTTLRCYSNQLTALDVSKNTALTTLRCSSNQLTALDLSGNTALTELDCSSNQLTALDLSGNTALTELDCSNNQLTALDVSNNTALKELDCYENQIKGAAMDALISSLPEITGEKAPFHVIYNRSWSTDGNDCTKEQVAAALAKGWQPMENQNWNWVPYEGSEPEVQIAINETNFPDENFRNYLLAQSYGADGVLTNNEIKGVTKINVYEKEISSLKGIEHFTALETLFCYGNQLTALDVSNNTALKGLSCGNNQLTALDISKNTALRSLSCGNNQLTALDVSKNTALRYLYCNDNQLTALDVSKNTALTDLYCYSNQIKGADMDALISSLPDKTGEYTVFRVIYNDEETIEGNACTKEQVAAAIAKGWEPMEYKDKEWVPYEGSDVTVQINTATISRGLQPVYTLSGQRVTAPKKGINIVGGKKVVVK